MLKDNLEAKRGTYREKADASERQLIALKEASKQEGAGRRELRHSTQSRVSVKSHLGALDDGGLKTQLELALNKIESLSLEIE